MPAIQAKHSTDREQKYCPAQQNTRLHISAPLQHCTVLDIMPLDYEILA